MIADQYIRYAYLKHLLAFQFDQSVQGGWVPAGDIRPHFYEALRSAFQSINLDIGDRYRHIVDDVIMTLIANEAIIQEGDQYTGIFWSIPAGVMDKTVGSILDNDPISVLIKRLGPLAFDRAIDSISSEQGWNNTINGDSGLSSSSQNINVKVPAADRVVTLSHNQSEEFEAPIGNLIDVLQDNNGVPDAPGLKEQILGQIRAGRELLRSGSFKAYLLYVTLLDGLRSLVDRYKGDAIEVAARTLIEMLIKKIFGASS